ncbi:DnaJ domain-containing protein [Flavobacterium sp. MFBS3-15]|uniref:DnaJ domain-containing protein n=1 Tax=Flavobacterium sp. MFBS3-15 TaxID=2989816 RepID=UPI0022357BC2|nr:DnaJ domain-containing protein [Flavobacterium sp. MFBS3-15]MCW4467786.1 DnaJ domain-containing protein [Flavobacterium sp. MFBS3-15]
MKDYYKILGIAPASSSAEIKKAYRLLALRHHPDRNEGDTTSEERFKEIAESYEILGDSSRRQDYDYLLANPGKAIHTDPHAKKTAATFLIIFKDIKSKVFNAGGYINKYALYKVMDDVLSEENIRFLSRTGDVCTINLIIDEILIAGVFLSDTSRHAIHDKLLLLANGDTRTLEKISVMIEKRGHAYDVPNTSNASENQGRAYFFILLIVIIILALAL